MGRDTVAAGRAEEDGVERWWWRLGKRVAEGWTRRSITFL